VKKPTIELSQRTLRRFCIVLALVLLIVGTAATSKAQDTIVYNNIPSAFPLSFPLNIFGLNPTTIPLNVFSQGAEAYGFTALGDGFTLAGRTGGTLNTVTVVLSSWACQSGSFQYGSGPTACVTTPGATYSMPVTVNVYSVNSSGTSLEGVSPSPAPGTLLATVTQSFNMPYRPSSNFVDCPATASVSGGYYEWYNAQTQTCQDGIDFAITFDLASKNVKLPTSEIIVTFSYNTSDYGAAPYGDSTPCHATTEGCFYDSLNISGGAGSAAYPGAVLAPSVGSVLNVNGIFTEFPSADKALCGTGTAAKNTLALDASPGCYTGNHPMIQVTTKSSF
jgi:hypothetical protein